jgi:hypothetical protein
MKKIYLSIVGLTAFGSIYGQNPFPAKKSTASQIIANPHHKTKSNNLAKTATAGPGHISGSVFAANVIALNSYVSGTDYNVYANPIFMDSTVVSSSSTGNSNIFNVKGGGNFDPKSIYWDGTGNQLLAPSDSYTVDSLWIGVGYSQVNFAANDTLIVEMAWGLPSSTTVYQALSISSVTPSLQFRTPKINSSTLHGDKSFLTAPASNYKKFKAVLTSVDTVGGVNDVANNGYVIIPNVNQLVPAGNMVSVAYTYKPGTVVAAGSVVHQYTGGSAQTDNGIVGYLYSDPATTSNYHFYDVSSYSGSFDYYTKQRYGLYTGGSAFLNLCGYPSTESSWDIGFSVTYVSSVGINELEANGAALGQNVPNPFNGESTVTYQLAKDANSVLFTVTDVMGRVISSEKASTSTGSHSIKLGSFAPGVYYYTLNVDGKTSTKKMIAQ